MDIEVARAGAERDEVVVAVISSLAKVTQVMDLKSTRLRASGAAPAVAFQDSRPGPGPVLATIRQARDTAAG